MEATEKKSKVKELKHLEFVRVIAIQTIVYVSNVCDYAKRNSGPLRSAVGSVESAVTTVVAPLYNKFKNVPDRLLLFVDNKLDEGTHKFDKHAPPAAKKLAGQVHSLMQSAFEKTQQLVNEARVGGPCAALQFAAKESKHFTITQSVKVWIKLNDYPVFRTASAMVVPTATHLSDKYNSLVKNMTQKHYKVFGLLPLVPVDEISEAYKQGKEKNEGAAHKSGDSSDSD